MENMNEFNSSKRIQDRAFEFSCRIVKLYQFLEKQGELGKILGKQILRSGTSIGANLEEASVGQSRADFISKCSISLKEARETYYWLRLFQACSIIPVDRISLLQNEANEIISILTTILKNARQSKS